MADRRWLFEGQTAGTTPSLTNTKSETGDDIITISSGAGGGGSVVYDDSWSLPAGGKSLALVNGTTPNQVRFPYANTHSVGAVDVSVKFAAEAAETRQFLRWRHAGGYVFSIARTSAGKCAVMPATGAAVKTGAVTLPLTVRFDVTYSVSAGATSDVTVKCYSAAGTLLETVTAVDVELSATSYSITNVEVFNSGIAGYKINVDSLGLRDGSASSMGPVNTSGAPVVGLSLNATDDDEFTLSWTHPADAPNGLSVVRADGAHVNDGLGRAPSDVNYDPLTITSAAIIATGRTSSPYVNTGLAPGTYTYWLVRTA